MNVPLGVFEPTNPGWAMVFFPNYTRDSQLVWMHILSATANLATYTNYPENALSFIGIVLNIAHFIILTRKSMRNSSVNIILAFLAIHDILSMTLTLWINFKPELVADVSIEEAVCTPSNAYLNYLTDYLKDISKAFFRRSSSWLVISMAVIRTLSISLFDNSNFGFLSTAKFGLIVILLEFILSSLVSLTFFIPYIPNGFYNPKHDRPWKQPKKCPDYNPNTTVMVHQFQYLTMAEVKRNELVNGLTINLIPCLLYPIFTIILVNELNNMKKKRSKMGQEKKQDRTTKIVLGMTISFLIAEFPQALAEIFVVLTDTNGLIVLGNQLRLIFVSVSLINGCTHCIICFGLSSNYRSAIYEIFGVQKTSSVSSTKMSSMRTASTATSKA